MKELKKIENLAPAKPYPDMTFYADSDESDTTQSPQKKRGRKTTDPSKYLEETERKIAAWEKELKSGVNKKG